MRFLLHPLALACLSAASLAAQAKADVNAEVVDALATDTYAEPGSVPAAMMGSPQ